MVKESGHKLIPHHDLSGGILSSHSAAFSLREKWKNLNLDVSLVASSAYVAVRVNDSSVCSAGKMIGFWVNRMNYDEMSQ
ncbi:hypothetical protein Tco_0872164 [Tanacetum coccineum]